LSAPDLASPVVEEAVRPALLEDLGQAGDITSAATIPTGASADGAIAARKPGVIAGLALAEAAFRQLDATISFRRAVADGTRVEAGAILARISGPARPILAAERVALNFLGHLSGVASATRRHADAVAHTRARITCTRKTIPGLRAFARCRNTRCCGGGARPRLGFRAARLARSRNSHPVCDCAVHTIGLGTGLAAAWAARPEDADGEMGL
jgi:nicotinate-nucleotide pyrophosphorylase (carboxylating)